MRALNLLALCCLPLALAACGPSANASLSGKVAFADGSDATGLNVSLVGPMAKQVQTAGGGAYSFDKIYPGIYVVEVDAADTKEGRLSLAIEVKGATSAPALTFNAVGSVKGKVVDSAGQPAEGISVFLTGSDRAVLTDSTGGYAFTDVPAGNYGLSARSSTPPRLADAMVTVKRGDNMGPTLMLADDTNAYGTLKGTLKTFVPGGSLTGLHAVAGGISVNTDAAGAWSVSLPPGNYEVVAGGGEYPDQSLGRFDVRSADVTTVPPATLSIYHAFPNASEVTGAYALALNDNFAAVVLPIQSDFSQELTLIDLHTFTERVVAVGPTNGWAFSTGGKWLTFRSGITGNTVAYNVATAQMWAMAVPGLNNGPVVSTDESVLFATNGTTLFRQDLSTGAVTTFTIPGGSGFFLSPDKFLLRSSTMVPFDIQMVGTTGMPTTVFTQQTNWTAGLGYGLNAATSGAAVTWASQVCSPNCTIQLMTSTQTAPVTVSGNTIVGFPSQLAGSTRDWFGFVYSGGRILVKTADGTSTALPATTYELHFNDDQSRVAFFSGTGDVREDSVPPNANAAIAITGPSPVGAYLSTTRFMVFTNGAAAKRCDIRSGTPTSDNDVDYQDNPLLFPPGASWVKKTTESRMGAVADQATDFSLSALIGPNYLTGGTVTYTGSAKDGTGVGIGKYAVISDHANLYVLDSVKGEARLEVGDAQQGGGISPRPFDRYRVNATQSALFRSFDDTKVVTFSEPGVYLTDGPRYLPGGKTIAAGVVPGSFTTHDRYFVGVAP